MRRIPTLYRRDPGDRRFVTDEVTPGCEWVLAGEGVAHRQLAGAGFLFDPEHDPDRVAAPAELQGWWARREHGPDAHEPPGWWAVEDQGERLVGYEPAEHSPHANVLVQAVLRLGAAVKPGTYELIGPRLNRNPEKVRQHELVAHVDTEVLDAPRDYEGLRRWVHRQPFSGVVWHHEDGRMAKIKRRDLRA